MALWNGYKKAIAVVASDTVNQIEPIDALFVCTTGNATIIPVEGAAIVLTGLPAGCFIPIKTKRVNSTGLTALLVGLWGQ